jgi:twitching motility protein PilT
MRIEDVVGLAKKNCASDIHLESGLPLHLRIRGRLKAVGDAVSYQDLLTLAQNLLGQERWRLFLEQKSFDFAKTISGRRCRIHVLQSYRGVGLAIRLLLPFQNTIERCNLHPDFKKFLARETGLIIVTGPTGCGKSTTLAAFIQEINLRQNRHIVTIEQPIEYLIPPKKSFIRQREVDSNTPSFQQALLDAMREDPDILVVGEMRTAETMRLTLNAAETGHLVFATMHSSNVADALNRIGSSFPAEMQGGVMAQLADCLVGVIAQRLIYLKEHGLSVPVCEVLTSTTASRGIIRSGDVTKLISVIQTSADEGMWTYERYQAWLDSREHFSVARDMEEAAQARNVPDETLRLSPQATEPRPARRASVATDERLEITPDDAAEIEQVISELEGRKKP